MALQERRIPLSNEGGLDPLMVLGWWLVKKDWVVVSNIFYFHPYLGKCSNLTHIFQMG